MASLVVKNGLHRDLCHNEIGLCAHYIGAHHSRLICDHNWEGLCNHLKRKNPHFDFL